MGIELTCGRLALGRRGVALLKQARGVRVTGHRGAAWLTIDGVRDDVVLNAGDAYRIDTDRAVVISAIAGPVEVAVQAAPETPRAASAARLWSRLRRRFSGPRPAIA